MKIGIVILNYLNWHDTVECIDSLADQTFHEYEVVIVDNASKNESFDELYSRYGNEENIHLLQSNENLGFAKGNNIGILYCKKVLGIKNILVMNNDVLFTDPNYLAFLASQSIDSNVGAMGTRIIGSDGGNQNPSAIFHPSFKAVFREFSFPLLRKYKLSGVLNVGRVIKRKLKKQPAVAENKPVSVSNQPFTLHGSVLFLTENYLEKMDGFYPGTFLYYEEEILALICYKLGLKLVYLDEVEIYHKEDQSSKLSFNNEVGIKYEMGRKSVRAGMKVSLMKIDKIRAYTNQYPYLFKVKKSGEEKSYQFNGG
ncbi:glycosyltransferase [Jeotgalibaca caeni]|uniref:glycosyltransferase n=1 Tax=Jeotgalibaca caeni TaxID=3028623 RepID=UPI00237DA7E2|nr:glycosyltransferase family 2 protein [Jeotgalibaca caeni]MDE1548153.1 glycosyltransferase family 2 protein [Jeotgalibaca caeni]